MILPRCADEDCYELLLHGEPTGVVELPVEWLRDDAPNFMMYGGARGIRQQAAPTDVLDIWRREFDGGWEEGGLFQLTCHPHVIGYRSRLFVLDELIAHARAKGGVWFATHAQVAAFAKANSGDSAGDDR